LKFPFSRRKAVEICQVAHAGGYIKQNGGHF